MLDEPIVVQGRLITSQHLDQIRTIFQTDPVPGRTEVSRLLCRRWDWRDEMGRLKDMACRSMLLKLQARDLIQLPPKRSSGGGPRKRVACVAHDQSPIECALADLLPIRLEDVRCGPNAALLTHLLDAHHYLGFHDAGRNMKYMAYSSDGRPLACLLFGGAAWKIKPRDKLLGWDQATRQAKLSQIANNTRFLILPWVKVPNLASTLLAQALDRLRTDWPLRYGCSLDLVETFVDRSRFTGACYRAANWICIGQTKGRSRQDRYNDLRVPVKDIYLYPMNRKLRKCLK